MSAPSIGTLTDDDIVVDHDGPGNADEYRYIAVDQVGGPPIALWFHLARRGDGGYTVSQVQSYDVRPVDLPQASTASEAADRINQAVADKLTSWGLTAA